MLRSNGGLRLALCALLLLSALPAGAQEVLYGAGSTLAAPLFQKWFGEYQAKTSVSVDYQAIGSSGGIKNITAHALDFGASDVPMGDAEMRAANGITHVPVAAYTVAVVYNLPGLAAPLRLSGPVLADIYLGRITRWNDPALTRLNPGQTLPDLAITPVHASNGGGTTYAFTVYLSAVSPDWKGSVGAGRSVHWPVGLGGEGEHIQLIKRNEGSLGYVELPYAVANSLPRAAIQNAQGQFVLPSVEATELAVAGVKLPSDLRGSLVSSPAPLSYPIAGYTYLLAYKVGTKPAVRDLLTWILTDGQKDAAEFQYAPLPPNVQKRALAVVAGIKSQK